LNKYILAWLKRFPNSFRSQGEKIDASNNVVDSIAKAKSLHKSLILKAHPDKHPNKTELAQLLTGLININRYNYSELLKIEKRINNELL
jgi:hypothetical protein